MVDGCALQAVFPQRPDLKSAILRKHPYSLKRLSIIHISDKNIHMDGNFTSCWLCLFLFFLFCRNIMKLENFDVIVKLQFGDGCMCSTVDIRHPVKLMVHALFTNSAWDLCIPGFCCWKLCRYRFLHVIYETAHIHWQVSGIVLSASFLLHISSSCLLIADWSFSDLK
jgi:hypothetical protein